jgi:tripartite-type tricarboxylate transporter receptor subunit TctC
MPPLLTPLWIVLCLAAGDALAQAYPAKQIRLVVTGAPGGGSDFAARLAGEKLRERLGRPVVVDNRAGAGGAVAATFVAKAPPDGYTLLLGTVGPLAVTPHVEKVGYDPLKDFAGVSLLASSYHVLAVHPSLPVRSVKQLVALAKGRPGELNYASGGVLTPVHLAPELFKSLTATDIVPIHYKGTSPAAVAVLSGEAQMLFSSVTSVMPHVRANRLVALAVTSPARSPLAPEVPTFTELGLRGVEAPSWYGIAAPAATPREAIDRLHGELAAIGTQPDFRAQLERQAMEPRISTPEQFAAFLQSEYDKWGRVVKGLKLN